VNSIKLHMGKDTWAFKKPNDKLEALAPNFLHNHIKCYELHKCVKMTWNILCVKENIHWSMWKNYATYDGFVNGANGLFQTTLYE